MPTSATSTPVHTSSAGSSARASPASPPSPGSPVTVARPTSPQSRPKAHQSQASTSAMRSGGLHPSAASDAARARTSSPPASASGSASKRASSSSSPPLPSLSPPQTPAPPTTSAPDADQHAAIDASLARRRRLRPQIFRSHSSSGSETFDPVEVHSRIRDEAEACELAYRHIELGVGGRIVHSEAEIPAVPIPTKAHYAWEIMYENQRGLSIFGKSWYSSNSLLPSDPTPFTLPLTSPDGDFILARPGASDSPALAGNSEPASDDGREGRDSTPQRHKSDKRTTKRRSIKTGYSLQTYQTPSPAWAWLTPWMVNMRHDTDQQGWRYNLWFHTGSWTPHPGRLNWWGWVRRREWVRLRALLPPEPEEDMEETERRQRDEMLGAPDSLDQVLDSKRPVANMTRYLAAHTLDREKLALWEKWMGESSAEGRHKLSEIFEDPGKLTFLSRAFIYPTARKAFFTSLVARGIVEDKDCMECSDILLEVEE